VSVSLISDNKSDGGTRLKLEVVFKNGEKKTFTCDYLGHSPDHPPMMVLLDDNDDEPIPVAVINSDQIEYLHTVKVIKVNKPVDGSEMH